MQHFEKQREETLLRFLDKLSTRDAVLSYPQIQGLLYAMACSPEPIKPSEWFELVWLNDDPQFDNPAEAKGFYELLVDLFGSIATDVKRDRFQLGTRVEIRQSAPALIDWCDGFLLGHHYLEDVWSAALDELDDDHLFEQVAATLDCAIAFVAADTSDWEDDDGFLLAEFVRFQQLLQEYRAIHMQCRHDSQGWSIEQAFLHMQPVDATAACPCGSGRLFKNCCLH